MGKYYVVRKGVTPGIYRSWSECQMQVTGYPNAEYKSFKKKEDAISYMQGVSTRPSRNLREERKTAREHYDTYGLPAEKYLVVDGGTRGNKGDGSSRVEYQIYDNQARDIVYNSAEYVGTSNIAEFLGLVGAIRYQQENNLTDHVIYTDSNVALRWYENQSVKTRLDRTSLGADRTYAQLKADVEYLKSLSIVPDVRKWETRAWGENPSDFGRKSKSRY